MCKKFKEWEDAQNYLLSGGYKSRCTVGGAWFALPFLQEICVSYLPYR